MTRHDVNLELAFKLLDLIDENPDQRFSQILQNYGFIKPQHPVKEPGQETWQNEFYMEPEELLERVLKREEDLNNGDEN